MIEISTNYKHVLQNERWTNFLESTAIGLRINITIITENDQMFVHYPVRCPTCLSCFRSLSKVDCRAALEQMIDKADKATDLMMEDGSCAIAMHLVENLFMIVRECACNSSVVVPIIGPALCERASIARRILLTFLSSLREGYESGQRAMEFSTLRQMNHIMLSLFQGDNNAASHCFDFILSALVILLDAEGSWIELYGEHHRCYYKGDKEVVDRYRRERDDTKVVAVEIINNNKLYGQIGVVMPVSLDEARKLVPVMMQECTIIIEIEYLFILLQNQMSKLLGAINSAVIVINHRGTITYANKAAGALFGYPILDLIGRMGTTVKGPWNTHINKNLLKSSNGHMCSLELEGGDQRKWIDWQASPILEFGTIMGWIVLVDDRTDYFNWQVAARKAERLSITGTLVSSLAHELRNPLSAAKGLIQHMGSRQDPNLIRSYTGLILGELDRVTTLLNDFLLLGRPSDIKKEDLDAKNFLEQLHPMIEGEAFSLGIKISLCLVEVQPVVADVGQLTQAVLNLTKNAIEAVSNERLNHGIGIGESDGNGGYGQVTITLQQVGNEVMMSVKDNGPGIPTDAMKHLFEPFFTKKDKGTGLGLSVTQAIIHNHGGTITAGNVPEGGALFTVCLPVATKRFGTGIDVDLLLVIADKKILYSVEQALRAVGFSFVSVYSLAEVFELQESLSPAALVIDGEFLSVEAQQQMYQTWAKTQILGLGEFLNSGDRIEIDNNVGNVELIPKPIDYAVLIHKIQKALE